MSTNIVPILTASPEPRPFDFNGQPIRVVTINGEPWFVLADACKVLGLTNPSMAAEGIDADALSSTEVIDSMGRTQNARITDESGIYALAFKSRKDEAKAFTRWVTKEVLPTIRKTGAYGQPVAELSGPELMAKALIEAQATLTAKDEQIKELAPAAKAWNDLSRATGDFVIAEAAKVVARAGCTTGPGRLHKQIEHEWNWLFRRGEKRKRVVRQEVIDKGWMVARITSGYFDQVTGERKNGHPEPRVTVKGVGEIARRLGGDPDAAMEVAREAIHEQEAEVTA